MKIIKKILIILFLITMLLTISSCKKKENIIGEIGILMDLNLDSINKIEEVKQIEIQKPLDLEVGEIAYVKNIYKDLAYVVLLRPMEPLDESSVGYIPINNLKFAYSPEEIKEISKYCHVIKDNTPVYENPNGKIIKNINSQYIMIEKRQKDWLLISQKGGDVSVWIKDEDIDYDFSRLVEDIKNIEFTFERQIE